MYKLIEKDLPCWYELAWQAKGVPAIILRVHEDFIKEVGEIGKEAPIVKNHKEKYIFPEFFGNYNRDFGFGGVFKYQGKRNGFAEFKITIPRIKKKVMMVCPRCHGLPQHELFDRECCKCLGQRLIWDKSGEEKHSWFQLEWKQAKVISATFTIFTLHASNYESQTSADDLQLMTIQTITRNGMHGGSLDGTYSKALTGYLSSFAPKTIMAEIVAAMRSTYNRMFGQLDVFGNFMAEVSYHNGWLNIDCPGEACGLHPTHESVKPDKGYQFSCHNVDSPAQQLTLIAGLAALHDQARREMKKNIKQI